MSQHFFEKVKHSWLNLTLATGSLFSLGSAQGYYRIRQAYDARARQYISNSLTGSHLKPVPHTPPKFRDLRQGPGEMGDLALVQGRPVRELVIVDKAVPQKQLFFSQARPGIDIVELNASENGLHELLNILAHYENLDAVHLFSHASPGSLQLGEERITKENLQAHPKAFAIINQAIKPKGDFLLYGCELGKGEAGEDFLELIQQNTHADLAASDDLTGSEDLNGDWELEIKKGDIDATPLGDSPTLKDFTEVLQWSGTVTFTSDGNFTDNGNYGGGESNDVSYTVGSYSMTLDGSGAGVGKWSYGGNQVSTGNNASQLTISFSNGESFDFGGITVYSTPFDNFTLKSDNPSDMQGFSAGAASANSVSVSSGFTGISKLYIEVNDGAGYFSVDDIILNNLQAGSFPITLTGFQAQRLGEAIKLNWSTASEQNNKGFEIEQSVDGENFEQIGFVEGVGNSSEEQTYEFRLRNSEAAYYRFKQIDLDGQHSYSPTRFIAAWEPLDQPFLHPNPITREVFIENVADEERLVVDLLDLQGKQVAILQGSKPEVEQQLSQRFEHLSKGMYLIQLRTIDRAFELKAIKQ